MVLITTMMMTMAVTMVMMIITLMMTMMMNLMMIADLSGVIRAWRVLVLSIYGRNAPLRRIDLSNQPCI